MYADDILAIDSNKVSGNFAADLHKDVCIRIEPVAPVGGGGVYLSRVNQFWGGRLCSAKNEGKWEAVKLFRRHAQSVRWKNRRIWDR